MGLEDLKEVVANYYCDRCGKKYLIEELVEDPQTPGILVCKRCVDKLGFEEMKAEAPREEIKHYFK